MFSRLGFGSKLANGIRLPWEVSMRKVVQANICFSLFLASKASPQEKKNPMQKSSHKPEGV
jgi:hypothetical protein